MSEGSSKHFLETLEFNVSNILLRNVQLRSGEQSQTKHLEISHTEMRIDSAGVGAQTEEGNRSIAPQFTCLDDINNEAMVLSIGCLPFELRARPVNRLSKKYTRYNHRSRL